MRSRATQREILQSVRVGIAHHLGWAVAVTASAGHVVVDRRRIELIEPGMPAAPVEHEARPLDDGAAARRSRRSGRRRGGQHPRRWISSPPRCPDRSSRYRCGPGRSTSRTTSPPSAARHTIPGPTRSCTARCSRSVRTCAAGRFTSSTRRTSRRRRPGSSVSEPAMCSADRGQRWDHRGPRIIGSRSPPRSLPGRSCRHERWRALRQP